MDFEFSDEQRQLHDAVEGFLAKEYAFDRLQSPQASGIGLGSERVARIGGARCALRSTCRRHSAVSATEPLETLTLMDACGPSLLLEPVLSSAVIATALLREYASVWRRPPICFAPWRAASASRPLAHFEPEGRFDIVGLPPAHGPTGAGYRLYGHKAVVLHAGLADTLLVSARTHGEAGDPQGVGLFLVPRAMPGVRLDEYLDGRRSARRGRVPRGGGSACGPSTRQRRRGAARDRSRDRHWPRCAVRRGRGDHAGAPERDGRVLAHPPTIWSTHRALPGFAAPCRRHG